MSDEKRFEGHRILLDFDSGYLTTKLICPDGGGCPVASMCPDCFRNLDDGGMGCDVCKDGFGDECVLKAWVAEEGRDLLAGEIEIAVTDVEWTSPDEGPVINVAIPDQPAPSPLGVDQ